MRLIKNILLTSCCVLVLQGSVIAAPAKQPLQLSAELMDLLRAEMQALLGAVQTIPAGIATADWHRVAETSTKAGASYILAQKLTPQQRHELKTRLPDVFKHLDAAFHDEAEKLAAAAMQHDAQLSSFHYYRMLETCTACHTVYATTRFPGFAPPTGREHKHGH